MTLFTIIALPFPYLVIYTLWSFMVWTKNTFLWARELYWMGHRTLNDPFLNNLIVHLPVYCVIITYCLLAHLLLSPTPIVPTHCSIVTATCCHLLPSDRQSGGSFVSPPPAVPFGTYWYLLVPTVTSRWRHSSKNLSRSLISTTYKKHYGPW